MASSNPVLAAHTNHKLHSESRGQDLNLPQFGDIRIDQRRPNRILPDAYQAKEVFSKKEVSYEPDSGFWITDASGEPQPLVLQGQYDKTKVYKLGGLPVCADAGAAFGDKVFVGEGYCLKVLSKHNYDNLVFARNEVRNVLRAQGLECVVKIYAIFETREHVAIVMEKLEKDLFKAMKSASERQMTLWTAEIYKMLFELHSLCIVHNDIKPSNIMIRHNGDGSKSLVWIDFGLSSDSRDRIPLFQGTISFIAPESSREEAFPSFEPNAEVEVRQRDGDWKKVNFVGATRRSGQYIVKEVTKGDGWCCASTIVNTYPVKKHQIRHPATSDVGLEDRYEYAERTFAEREDAELSSEASDVYAATMTVFEMFSKMPPESLFGLETLGEYKMRYPNSGRNVYPKLLARFDHFLETGRVWKEFVDECYRDRKYFVELDKLLRYRPTKRNDRKTQLEQLLQRVPILKTLMDEVLVHWKVRPKAGELLKHFDKGSH